MVTVLCSKTAGGAVTLNLLPIFLYAAPFTSTDKVHVSLVSILWVAHRIDPDVIQKAIAAPLVRALDIFNNADLILVWLFNQVYGSFSQSIMAHLVLALILRAMME